MDLGKNLRCIPDESAYGVLRQDDLFFYGGVDGGTAVNVYGSPVSEDILQELFVQTTEFVQKFGLDMNMDFGARTLIIVSALPDSGGNTNAGCIVENMVLAATDLGIDSVIMGIIPAVIKVNEELLEKLGIPEGFAPVLSAVFGYGVDKEDAKEHHISVNWV